MKSKEEILKRAIVLLAFSDRCALEKRTIDGVRRTTAEREAQRQAISNWLLRMGYWDCVSEKEKQVFSSAITEKANTDILSIQRNYECVEPLLWTLGLVSELSPYDGFVTQDFHPTLKFGRNHSFDALLADCHMTPNDRIPQQRKMSMLWYWRCLEHRSNTGEDFDMASAVKAAFGEEYLPLLHVCSQYDSAAKDFIVTGKRAADLSDEEMLRLSIISERRFYAFEWLSTDDDWDSVDLVC